MIALSLFEALSNNFLSRPILGGLHHEYERLAA